MTMPEQVKDRSIVRRAGHDAHPYNVELTGREVYELLTMLERKAIAAEMYCDAR